MGQTQADGAGAALVEKDRHLTCPPPDADVSGIPSLHAGQHAAQQAAHGFGLVRQTGLIRARGFFNEESGDAAGFPDGDSAGRRQGGLAEDPFLVRVNADVHDGAVMDDPALIRIRLKPDRGIDQSGIGLFQQLVGAFLGSPEDPQSPFGIGLAATPVLFFGAEDAIGKSWMTAGQEVRLGAKIDDVISHRQGTGLPYL